MEPSSSSSGRKLRISGIVWAAVAILVAGLAAVTLLRVPIDLAVSYGLIALMIIAHSVMHGGHASHGAHDHPRGEGIDPKGGASSEDKPTHRGRIHSGC